MLADLSCNLFLIIDHKSPECSVFRPMMADGAMLTAELSRSRRTESIYRGVSVGTVVLHVSGVEV